MTRALLAPLTSHGAALPTLPTVVPVCRMAPATIKPQAVLQHARGTTTSSGWGHRAGPTRSRRIWKVHQIPAIDNMLFSAQVSTAWGRCAIIKDSALPNRVHTSVASAVMFARFWYRIKLVPLPRFAELWAGLLVYLGKYSAFGSLGLLLIWCVSIA